MKRYVCDCCNKIIEDPYEAQMKEFMYTAEYDFGTVFPIETRYRKKLHLCGSCFANLKSIAEQKERTKDTMLFEFKIIEDAGRISFVCASCRADAIKLFCENTGVSTDYIKNHCIIKNMGRCS